MVYIAIWTDGAWKTLHRYVTRSEAPALMDALAAKGFSVHALWENSGQLWGMR